MLYHLNKNRRLVLASDYFCHFNLYYMTTEYNNLTSIPPGIAQTIQFIDGVVLCKSGSQNRLYKAHAMMKVDNRWQKIDIADVSGATIDYKSIEVNGNMIIGVPYSCGGMTVIPHFNVVTLFENNQETENQ